MLLLVNQLLNLSKLDAGKLAIQYQQANIIPFLNYLVNSFQSLAHSKNISLVLNGDVKQLLMDYDPEKMQTILSNLLSNAIKFTPKHGQVIIHIKQVQTPIEQLLISIKDNGIGIKKESLPYIFDRFHQEQGQHKNTGEGSGIGLALVKELVDLLDAKIVVKSELDQGSEFSLLFPINRNAPLITPDNIQPKESILLNINEETNENKATNKPTILVVEDNPDVRFFISSCLKNHYRILEAADGQQGIDRAIKESPDLVISDVMMPKKDGFELCAAIKNHENTDHIPIILLTAKATQDDKNHGLLQGADAYLIKPFDKEELLIRVEKLLETREKLLYRFQQFADIESTTHPKSLSINPFLQKIDILLEQKYTDELFNTQTLCKALGMSKTLMYESIKKEASLSPGLYIRAFRLRKAKKHLLENKSLTIREVAYSVGFKSPVYFSQEFKKAFDCSAGEFREKNQ